MKATTISDYIKLSTAILLANSSYLYVFIILGMGLCTPMLISPSSAPEIALMSLAAFIIIYPLIYGRFIEILSGQEHISWLDISQKHWVNYMVVNIALFLLFSPVLIIFSVPGFTLTTGLSVVSVLVSVSGIYIFPLVFLTRERIPSIRLGFQCLSGNFQFTIPLMIIMVVPVLFSMLYPQDSTPLSALLSLVFFTINIFVDFIVFIAAGLILRDKLNL